MRGEQSVSPHHYFSDLVTRKILVLLMAKHRWAGSTYKVPRRTSQQAWQEKQGSKNAMLMLSTQHRVRMLS